MEKITYPLTEKRTELLAVISARIAEELIGLPKLISTDIVIPEIVVYKNGKGTDSKWHMETIGLPKKERAKARSKTFPGIAKAMAQQWGNNLKMNESEVQSIEKTV